jgi:hypothetical protein
LILDGGLDVVGVGQDIFRDGAVGEEEEETACQTPLGGYKYIVSSG